LSSNYGFFTLMFTVVITMIIIIIRIRKAIQGTKVNVKRIIIFSAYFLGVASFLVYNSFLIGSVPRVYAIPYFATISAAVYCSYIYSKKKTLSFSKLPDRDTGTSAIYVKGGLSIYLLYVAALTIRIAINYLFIGSETFYFNNQQSILANATFVIRPIFQTDPTMIMLAFTIADFLLMIGAGLIIGRNTRVLEYYYRQKKRAMS
jgi:hypothetical protein